MADLLALPTCGHAQRGKLPPALFQFAKLMETLKLSDLGADMVFRLISSQLLGDVLSIPAVSVIFALIFSIAFPPCSAVPIIARSRL